MVTRDFASKWPIHLDGYPDIYVYWNVSDEEIYQYPISHQQMVSIPDVLRYADF